MHPGRPLQPPPGFPEPNCDAKNEVLVRFDQPPERVLVSRETLLDQEPFLRHSGLRRIGALGNRYRELILKFCG